jgi:hypothetical protein
MSASSHARKGCMTTTFVRLCDYFCEGRDQPQTKDDNAKFHIGDFYKFRHSRLRGNDGDSEFIEVPIRFPPSVRFAMSFNTEIKPSTFFKLAYWRALSSINS